MERKYKLFNTNIYFIRQLNMIYFALFFIVIILTTGCVPKEVALPTVDPSLSPIVYGEFKGATNAETINATKIKLSWVASSDSDVVAYNIYDSTFRFNAKLIKTVNAPLSEVIISGLTSQTYYSFRVRATNSKNEEDSNMVDLPAIPYGGILTAQVQSSTSATLPFNDASNADSVQIYCKTGSNSTWNLMATVTNISLTQSTLSNLSAGTSYTCRANLKINGYEDNNTTTTTFVPMGQAAKLAFTSQPGSANAGSSLSPQPIVTIQDINGNTVSAGPDSNTVITLTISATSPTIGTIQGTASVPAVNGVATFSGLNIQEAGIKILSATKGDTSGLSFGSPAMAQDSNSFTISAGNVSASTSTIAVTPEGPLVANGSSSYAVTITLKDQYGNPVAGIIPAFASSVSSDILIQANQPTNSTGVATATFSATSVGGTNNNGIRTLNISSPSGLTTVTTTATFIPGPANQLAFTQQPQTSPAGPGGMTSNVLVAIQDANGNLVANSDSSASTSVSVKLYSSPSGGVLLGTTTVNAVNGIATFSGLGIDKTGSNYKMKALASDYPTLTQPISYPFNITSAPPTKVVFSTGPSSLISSTSGTTSSVCGTYTIQLQDGGNNPANATGGNIVINLSGSPTTLFYNSSNCSGSPVTSKQINNGQNQGTISVRDSAAELLTLTASNSGLTSGTKDVQVSPSQFVLSGGPMSTKAGVCSPGFTLSTQGANGSSGPVFSDTNFVFSFLNSGLPTNATAYNDSACTQSLGASPTSITVASNTSSKMVYFKNQKAEGPATVTFSAQNNMNVATSNPSSQTVTFIGASLSLTPPSNTSLRAGGACIGPFIVKALDADGAVATNSNTTLNFTGGTATSKFYNSSSCSSPVTTLTLSSGIANFWLSDTLVESLSIRLIDPTPSPLTMTSTSIFTLQVKPYKLAITNPTGAQNSQRTGPLPDSDPFTLVCLPITIASQYSSGTNVAPLSNITIDLLGGGVQASTGASYYTDNACTQMINGITLSSGSSNTTVYFMSLNPGAFNLSASDNGLVLQSTSTLAVTIAAKPAWIGTRQGGPSPSNDFSYTFQIGTKAVSPRMDGPRGSYKLHFDASKTLLHSVDFDGNRIFQYNYQTSKLVGWIGGFNSNGGASSVPITGGSLGCSSITNYYQQTPGWCTGGAATSNYSSTYGGMYNPSDATDDGYNLYVSNYNGNTINMYNLITGEFEGWIGLVNSTSTINPVGIVPTSIQPGKAASADYPNGVPLSNTCASAVPGDVTPGFCAGGGNAYYYGYPAATYSANMTNQGNGRMYYPRALLWVNNNLYVGVNGAILKFDATPGGPDHGKFLGWIGWVNALPSSCPNGSPSTNAQTPGWCKDGTSTSKTPTLTGGINTPVGLWADVANDWLYVSDTSRISRYVLSTGAFDSLRLNTGLVDTYQISSNNSNLFVADSTRIIKLDMAATGLLGWLGKVNQVPTAPSACMNLNTYDNTPGWCSNGTSTPGLDERALVYATAIEQDGQGNLLTGQRNFPMIKKWDASTGVYQGQLVMPSTSSLQWTTTNEIASFYGFDDQSMFNPMGTTVRDGYLYLAEQGVSRVKKISTATGEVVGWIGGITTLPTGGDSSCTQVGLSVMAASPGWCLGAYPNPTGSYNIITQNVPPPGVMYSPTAVTTDSNYLYVTDVNYHRIQRYWLNSGTGHNAGEFDGWIGWINTVTPMSCTGGSPSTNSPTPGWCKGGTSTTNSKDGGLYTPTGIWYSGGNLYVVDYFNYRISSFNAATGAFNGWIGQMNTNTAGCTTQTINGVVYTSGWCKSSSGVANSSIAARATNNSANSTGGFAFGKNGSNYYAGISGDNTYMYISHDWNNRIDRFWLNSGTGYNAGDYAGSLHSNYNLPITYPNWTLTPGTPGAWGDIWTNSLYPSGIYVDATNGYLYYTSNMLVIVKRNLSDGSFVGWNGAVGSTPSSCSESGTMSIVTPGWCQGGSASAGYTFGKYAWGAAFLSGDSNYIYVSDYANHRVTRIPK